MDVQYLFANKIVTLRYFIKDTTIVIFQHPTHHEARQT